MLNLSSSSSLSGSTCSHSSSSFIDIFLREILKLNIDPRYSLLYKKPNIWFSWTWGIFFNCYWLFLSAVSGVILSKAYLFMLGVSIWFSTFFIFLLIELSKSSRPLMKFGWLKMLRELSFRDLWKPYMLSCRMKLLIFLCLKNFGKTISCILLMSLMTKSLPLEPQKIILEYSSFWFIERVHSKFRRSLQQSQLLPVLDPVIPRLTTLFARVQYLLFNFMSLNIYF